ncbi:hypothetical protein F0L74_02820 [Chitinophaga agrisoli]|uniref:Nucleoside 2-deoxyribosyltransferase-like protein n=1 Tax=Chitinophaga agrisoli TaxID=2607653 RepID=A0A5B2W2J9_9BACT|nr:nucleoside 2-deoxyribosyltransferase domain-containing protein [Chitinophaga agrisoli]KAA2244912.1 hypothetical protein F0L74_02820 [Chitinophaga agrisoli]
MTIKAPVTLPPKTADTISVFLAGSIEMGSAIHWQQEIEQVFDGRTQVHLYNPRRDDWDSSWKQEITHPAFNEQVNWELDAMEAADLIIMYFAPGTYSPVTLLELGLHARSGKLVVCCPEGFWRKGNVDIVCEKFGVKQVPNITALIDTIHSYSLNRTIV